MNRLSYVLLFFFLLLNTSCGVYSYTSTCNNSPQTISVNQLKNNITLHYIDFNYKLKNALEDKLNQQYDLVLEQKDGHFIFHGTIYNYSNKVISTDTQNNPLFNRLSINLNITLENTIESTRTSKKLIISTDYLSRINFEKNRDSLENVLIEKSVEEIYSKFHRDW